MLTNGGDVNAWLSETGKSLRYAFALKGQNEIAQGNALGKWLIKPPALKGRKGSVADYRALSGLI